MIFCPTLTLATAKDEMKAIRDCQRRHAILRVTILRPWCIAFQEWSPDRRIHWRFRSNATFPGKNRRHIGPGSVPFARGHCPKRSGFRYVLGMSDGDDSFRPANIHAGCSDSRPERGSGRISNRKRNMGLSDFDH